VPSCYGRLIEPRPSRRSACLASPPAVLHGLTFRGNALLPLVVLGGSHCWRPGTSTSHRQRAIAEPLLAAFPAHNATPRGPAVGCRIGLIYVVCVAAGQMVSGKTDWSC
jgi:hypothetical protein